MTAYLFPPEVHTDADNLPGQTFTWTQKYVGFDLTGCTAQMTIDGIGVNLPCTVTVTPIGANVYSTITLTPILASTTNTWLPGVYAYRVILTAPDASTSPVAYGQLLELKPRAGTVYGTVGPPGPQGPQGPSVAPGITYTFPSDADQTLNAQQSLAPLVNIAQDGTTTKRKLTNITAPSAGMMSVLVANGSLQLKDWAWATGAAVTIPSLTSAIVGSDGTDARIILQGGAILPIGPGTGPTLSAYADVAGSFAALFPTTTGTIAADTDSVTGQAIERYTAGAYRTANAGVFDFASQGATSFVLVWRQSLYGSTGDHIIYDSTNGGTTRGVQVVARDNYPTSTAGRQLIGRVFDGTSWIVDYTPHGPVEAYQSLIWSVAVVTITSTSLSILVDGCNWITYAFSPITFPSGAASAAKIGNGPFDLLAFEVWRGGLSTLNALAVTSRLQNRFSLPYRPQLLWTDPNWGESDPGACTLSDNTFVAITTKYPGPGANIGHIEARTSADGITWTPTPGSDGSGAGLTLPFTVLSGGGVFDACITQLSDGSVVAVANQTAAGGSLVNGFVKTLKAASPAAVRSNTWANETAITPGTATVFELITSDITEDPAHPGTCYALTYRQSGAETFPSIWQYKSTDYCTTWSAGLKILDGVSLSMYFAEAGLKFVTAAAAAKYSDLTTGGFFYLVRNETTSSMDELTSATGLFGSFTRRTTNLSVHSAARYRFLQDGTMVFLGRDNSTQYNTVFRRTGVSGGIAQYTATPVAPSIVPTFGDLISGQNNGQYGMVCAEVTAGVPLFVTATRLGLNLCSTYARFWPKWQIYGQMPIVVSPATVATQNAGATVQFTAHGAGGYVWSLVTNATGGNINASTGLYTTGSAGGTDTIRCTDQNGYFDATKDVSILVNAGSGALPDQSFLIFNYDASITASVSPTSGSVNSVANQNGATSSATSGASLKPVYGTTTLNSLKTLDFTGGKVLVATLPGTFVVGFSDHTFMAVVKMGSSVAGPQVFAGNSASGTVYRADNGVLRVVDYANGSIDILFTDLVMTANTAHVVVFKRTGSTWTAWLDGVKSTVTGTTGTNPFQVAFTIGNDDSATLFGEQFLGQEGQLAMWNHAVSDANVVIGSATMKTKWGTT